MLNIFVYEHIAKDTSPLPFSSKFLCKKYGGFQGLRARVRPSRAFQRALILPPFVFFFFFNIIVSIIARETREFSRFRRSHRGAQQNRARKFVFPLRFVSVRFENEKKYTDEDNDGDENEDEEKEHLRRRRGRWKRRERDDADDARKQR